MDKINEIRDFIWEHIDEENGHVIEKDDIEDIYDLISATEHKFGVNIKLDEVGGFDSPGYRVEGYAWAGVIDGELYFDSLDQQFY